MLRAVPQELWFGHNLRKTDLVTITADFHLKSHIQTKLVDWVFGRTSSCPSNIRCRIIVTYGFIGRHSLWMHVVAMVTNSTVRQTVATTAKQNAIDYTDCWDWCTFSEHSSSHRWMETYHFSMSFTFTTQTIKGEFVSMKPNTRNEIWSVDVTTWQHKHHRQVPSAVFISTSPLFRWRCSVVIDAVTIDVKHNDVSWSRWILPDHWQLYVNSFRTYLPFTQWVPFFAPPPPNANVHVRLFGVKRTHTNTDIAVMWMCVLIGK